MTVTEARKLRRAFYNLTNPTDEDRFVYTEALEFLIRETKDSDYMVELGSMYYEQKRFDLALKYYEMAAEYNNRYAISNLGYIWYYGRTGKQDFEKAFFYFDRARQMGDMIAAYKVADMYKNGYHVAQDLQKYKEIVEDLYQKLKDASWFEGPVPEVLTRLAKIRAEEGKAEEALELYDEARFQLAERILNHPFFGDLNIMKWMIADIYQLREFDEADMDIYDLYFLLAEPAKVKFFFEDEVHEAEAVKEEGGIVIRFDETWFRTIDDFFQKAELGGELLTTRYGELYDFKVVREWN